MATFLMLSTVGPDGAATLTEHPDRLKAVNAEVEKRLAAVGKKVNVAVNYDNFYIAPDLSDQFVSAVRALAEHYYESVTRYSTSAFLRLKLHGQLTERGLAPHIYESRQEALEFLTKSGG